ncbi:MAG TPA: GAF domain-containing protein [Gaiellaceae bacterium]|nr:GAF domain-containing protein [Gaiellaceae bacterium]
MRRARPIANRGRRGQGHAAVRIAQWRASLTGWRAVANRSTRESSRAADLDGPAGAPYHQFGPPEKESETASTQGSEELQAAVERERLVAEISRQVRSDLDLDNILQLAVEGTARAFGVARCFIRLGERGEPMPVRAEWDAPDVDPVDAHVAERLPASNLAAAAGRTVAIGDVESADELDDPGRETLLSMGTRAVLTAPIVIHDRMIGTLALHGAETRDWTEADVSLAEAVAGEVALAVHTARLVRENERGVEEQAALLNAAHALTSELRFESVLQRLVDEVTPLLRAEAAECYLYDAERELLRCAAVTGLPPVLVGRTVPVGEGLTGRAVETGRPVIANEDDALAGPRDEEASRRFRRAVVAPITWLGETRGVLGVATRDAERFFEERDAELLDAFARLAALALHNAESFEERERQAQIQRGFYRIAEVLASPLSLGETLDALARAACETLGATSALVLEPRAEGFVVGGSYGWPGELADELAAAGPLGGPLFAIDREGVILASTALAEDERLEEPWRRRLAAAGYRALLSVAVESRGERRTVVVLFTEDRAFSDDDLALVRHLADAARGALERSELFETERRARNLSQRLASIGARLVTNLDPTVVVDEVVRETIVLLEADAATIRLLDGEELVVHAAAGALTDLVGTRTSAGAGLLRDVVQSRSPVAVEDARASSASGDPVLADAMVSTLAVPMIAHGGGLHGVLNAYARQPRTWRDDELQALAALAAGTSAALSNAELYQRVAEEKDRSEAILGNIADGIVAVDRDERIVLWNAAAERITGVPVDEALGRRVVDVLQRELTSDGAPGTVSILRGGKEVWLSLTEAVMTDGAGAVTGRIFAFRDVSDERVVEQMKSDFVSAVSHELRTPLTSIYGFAETLRRGDVSFSDEERGTFLQYIASESERLIRIVDDLLNVARLEAGALGLEIADTDVGEVVREVVARVGEEMTTEHRFAIDAPEEPLYAEADRAKLSQVVSNLVDNAVKFSPRGATITIAARRRADTIEVRVTDEGVGIPRGDLQRIFAKFYRADTAPVSGVPGTGLGLFLVRGLLAAMGGRVWVDSRPGQGSSFVFVLPASRWPAVGTRPVEVAARGG